MSERKRRKLGAERLFYLYFKLVIYDEYTILWFIRDLRMKSIRFSCNDIALSWSFVIFPSLHYDGRPSDKMYLICVYIVSQECQPISRGPLGRFLCSRSLLSCSALLTRSLCAFSRRAFSRLLSDVVPSLSSALGPPRIS
jgi:hypothetical protein